MFTNKQHAGTGQRFLAPPSVLLATLLLGVQFAVDESLASVFLTLPLFCLCLGKTFSLDLGWQV